MKTTIPLCAGLLMMASASIWGVATIGLSNYEADMPLLLAGTGSSSSLAPVAGSYVELLANGVPVIPFTSDSSIFTLSESGYFYEGIAKLPGVLDGGTVQLTLRAWRNASSYDAAAVRGSLTWSQKAGSWNPNAIPPAPLLGPPLAIPQSLTMTNTSTPPNPSASVATISLSNYESAKPVRLGSASQPGALAPIQGTYVEILANGVPVVSDSTGSSILGLTEAGYFYGGVGGIGGVAAGATVTLTLRAWRDAATYDNATARGSVTWSQATGTWYPNAMPPSPKIGPALALNQPVYISSSTPPINVSSLATIGVNNYETSMPIKVGKAGQEGVLAPVEGHYVELLANGLPVKSNGNSILSLSEPGYFYAGVLTIPEIKGGSVVQFTLRAWQNAASFDAATVRTSLTWNQMTGSWNPNAVPPAPILGPALALTQSILLTLPAVQPLANTMDFNRDGNSDLLFQHNDGALAIWFLENGNFTSGQYLDPERTDREWRLACNGDLNRDQKQDLLFQHSDGTLAVWYMDQTSMVSAELLTPSNTAGSWALKAAGDFNGDGKADLLFQHADATLAVWLMDGSKMVSGQLLSPSHPGDSSWRVAGLSDFNSDGKTDILFQHEVDGDLAVWFMDGVSLKSAQLLNPFNPGSPLWKAVALADYNKDGHNDIIFQSGGSLAVWHMDGINLIGGAYLTKSPIDPAWQVGGPR